MRNLQKFNENVENGKMRKFAITTKSESSDYYMYFIEHPQKPTRDELNTFLQEHANDKDGDEVYEYVEIIQEIIRFDKIPRKVTYLPGEIEPGDTVEYIKRVPTKTKERFQDIPIYGVWDGTKVEFDDDEKMVVRSTKYLRKCKI
jgi:hypothetical protein